MDTRSGRFPLVDSLRAIAALAVLLHHVGGYSGAFNVPVIDWYALQFQAGVALFFCISGFLLYRPFVAARLGKRPLPATGAYAWRRFLRIVPAYWVVLTILAVTVAPEVRDEPLLYYGFAQVYDWSHALDGLDVAWTLCIEVAFYAMLPFYALAMRALPARGPAGRLRWEVAGLVLLVTVAIAFRIWGLDGHENAGGVATLLTLPAFLDWFALGMGLALLSVWLDRRERTDLPSGLAWIERRPSVCWLVALGWFSLAAWAFHDLPDPSPRLNMAQHLTFAGVGIFMLVPAVIGDAARGGVRRFLAVPTLAWLGLISYGIYLWQRPMIQFVDDSGVIGAPSWLDPNVLWLVIVLPLTIIAAAISYYVVERPVLSLKRLVSPRGVQPDQPGAVSAPAVPEPR
jgi:peptidoglycan/LPS O-acetylase OafA/YrhL